MKKRSKNIIFDVLLIVGLLILYVGVSNVTGQLKVLTLPNDVYASGGFSTNFDSGSLDPFWLSLGGSDYATLNVVNGYSELVCTSFNDPTGWVSEVCLLDAGSLVVGGTYQLNFQYQSNTAFNAQFISYDSSSNVVDQFYVTNSGSDAWVSGSLITGPVHSASAYILVFSVAYSIGTVDIDNVSFYLSGSSPTPSPITPTPTPTSTPIPTTAKISLSALGGKITMTYGSPQVNVSTTGSNTLAYYVPIGTAFTLTPYPNTGNTFLYWTANGVQYNAATLSWTASADVIFSAAFGSATVTPTPLPTPPPTRFPYTEFFIVLGSMLTAISAIALIGINTKVFS